MPWSWFIGLRKLRMTRLEATLAALFVHSIHSWRKFGLELEAFHEYGLFTQAYGMAILPLAGNLLISLIFLRVLRVESTLSKANTDRHKVPSLNLTVTLTSNFGQKFGLGEGQIGAESQNLILRQHGPTLGVC